MRQQRIASRLTRRELLCAGGLTAFGLMAGEVLRCRQLAASQDAAAPAPPAKACILIWLDGGPSHLETFDVKPNAPVEVRGPLGSIATQLAGVRISECMPRTAKIMNKMAIVRSVTSPLGEHNFGTHYLMTGYKPTPALEYPAFGSVLAHARRESRVLPANIAIPDFHVGGANFTGGGYLAASTYPFSVGGDPSQQDFRVRDLDFYPGVDQSRLKRRRDFVRAMDEFSPLGKPRAARDADQDLERAYRLLTSPESRQAFDLTQEPDKLRRRYGPKAIGQCCLLARRLVERGVPFVTVNNRGWDTHDNLQTRLKEGYTGAPEPGVGLVPSLDLAFSALLEDLDTRGRLDETLVVVMGEFGRTPKLNVSGGRDHWPRVFSVALAGGGVPGGQVVGSSDAVGESPRERPVTPSDLAATLYTLLGVDPRQELRTLDGRPIRVTPPDASPIRELIG